jgi:hypothetical protein
MTAVVSTIRERRCLYCLHAFTSRGSHNRICRTCTPRVNAAASEEDFYDLRWGHWRTPISATAPANISISDNQVIQGS